MPITLIAATIVVSGFPPVHATQLRTNGYDFGISTTSRDLIKYLAFGHDPKKQRCHGCRHWVNVPKFLDARLGYDGYCDRCVATHVQVCQSTYGRVPGRGEFYCMGCSRILSLMDRCPPDADGRRRARCKACRRGQVMAANARMLRRG